MKTLITFRQERIISEDNKLYIATFWGAKVSQLANDKYWETDFFHAYWWMLTFYERRGMAEQHGRLRDPLLNIRLRKFTNNMFNQILLTPQRSFNVCSPASSGCWTGAMEHSWLYFAWSQTRHVEINKLLSLPDSGLSISTSAAEERKDFQWQRRRQTILAGHGASVKFVSSEGTYRTRNQELAWRGPSQVLIPLLFGPQWINNVYILWSVGRSR